MIWQIGQLFKIKENKYGKPYLQIYKFVHLQLHYNLHYITFTNIIF